LYTWKSQLTFEIDISGFNIQKLSETIANIRMPLSRNHGQEFKYFGYVSALNENYNLM